ncbi:LysM peptidoglycan-binding domain-containing protein [Actomonas aquatica]|uniref:LysM peptidoglycan-binding domain-containing protein n=1 Tax=Actomonas aquatica TaxID=2866162 RepID=A0ABZ1C5A1_9BACT|nr:LysM peptidoglycan-binding domain-containing protein [Opitutus sp. WL0086]WRQ86908.1 LysM peptidoglycan-binding domain-containing protein [Opitutus sp. WL0086]
MTDLILCHVPTRREFLHHTLWSALALWAAPTALWAADGQMHIVRKGDTLIEIARDYGTTVKAIKNANGLRTELIKVGQKLSIPSGAQVATVSTYVVKKGDTLGLIARHHGTDVRTLKRVNHLKSDLIRVGQKLSVPSGGSAPSNSAALAPVIAATDKIRVDSSRWKYIVCHHSAIEAGNAEIYGKAHLRRGMEHGLAYHFVIGNGRDSGDGEIEIGPRWKKQLRGGHVRKTSVNDSGIGICMVGNFENHRPTRRQRAAVNELLDYLCSGYVRSNVEVTVHKRVDLNHTLCPGKYFPYGDLKRFA